MCKIDILVFYQNSVKFVKLIFCDLFKVTFADMLANVGGTFGLFLGLSFLSIFEMAVEIGRFVQKKIPKTFCTRVQASNHQTK